MLVIQGNFLRYEIEIERHQKYRKCQYCNDNTPPDLPRIEFQMALQPARQINTDSSIGLMREF